jgi:hypothetical protein
MAASQGVRYSVDAEGLPQTLRAMRAYARGCDTRTGELRDAAQRTAADLGAKVQRALSSDGDPRSPVLAVTVRVSRGMVPSFRVGGSRKVFSSGTDGFPTAAGRLLFGTEFGAARSSPGGYRPHRGRQGYAIYPTIRQNRDVTVRNYRQALDQLAREWGRGG